MERKWIMSEDMVKFRGERETRKKSLGVPVLSVGQTKTSIAKASWTKQICTTTQRTRIDLLDWLFSLNIVLLIFICAFSCINHLFLCCWWVVFHGIYDRIFLNIRSLKAFEFIPLFSYDEWNFHKHLLEVEFMK